jgi:hypothetical protein
VRLSAAINATACTAAAAADTIKAGLYLLNSLLYSSYHTLRIALVMSGYAGPFTEDLTAVWQGLDLSTLWNTGSAQTSSRYPLEPVVSQRDLIANQAHPFSPYRPREWVVCRWHRAVIAADHSHRCGSSGSLAGSGHSS